MPTWLVTGGSGFLGRHLLDALNAEVPPGVLVVTAGRSRPAGWPVDRFVTLDLQDRTAVSSRIASVRPAAIFHLAGKTPPGSPEEFDRMNTEATVGLLDAVASSDLACRVVVAGSAAELGPVPIEALPVAEEYPGVPADAYGRSKWRATRAALATPAPAEVMVARVFNPIGPGLPAAQALGRFARLLAEGAGPIRLVVGDLDARRDFLDARDVAGAFLALMARGRPGQVYHLGTGRSHSVREGLDHLIALSGRDVTIEIDPEWARSRGVADSRADTRRIREEIGWSPTIPWEQSLRDLWDDVSGRVRRG